MGSVAPATGGSPRPDSRRATVQPSPPDADQQVDLCRQRRDDGIVHDQDHLAAEIDRRQIDPEAT